MIAFIDVDGTLLDSSHRLRERTSKALVGARDCGHTIVVCSGRCYDGMKAVLDELPFSPYLATLNGAYILSDQLELIAERPFPKEDALLIAQLIRKHGLGHLYFTGRAWGSGIERDWEHEAAIVHNEGLHLPLEDVIAERPVHKILPVCPQGTDKATAFLAELHEALPALNPITSSPIYIEINMPGVSKGLAVETLAAHLGVDVADTVAVGDWDNDIPMFRAAGRSACLSNGSPAALAAAGERAASNDEDGLALWLEENLIR